MKKLFVLALCIFASAALSAKPDKKAAEKAVAGFLENVKKGDFAKAGGFIEGGFDVEAQYSAFMPVLKIISSQINYKIISSNISEDGEIIVKTKISAPDMPKIMEAMEIEFSSEKVQSAVEKAETEEEKDKLVSKLMTDFISKSVSDKNHLRIDTDVDISVSENEGKWILTGSDELASGIIGQMDKYAEKQEAPDVPEAADEESDDSEIPQSNETE
ncbi:MAG: hypothetical protein KAZ87_03015 [Spirochaetes bacterium]|nr:hypothetical protein [Spirochaetota bacterium]